MLIKKFRCINCGGPKVNPYLSPYVVCDFCGSLTDIDFAVGMDTWNESAERTMNYSARKAEYMMRMQAAQAIGRQDLYHDLQREFWDFYYRCFPAFLPPTIDDPQSYAIYLDVCALSSVESAFDPKWQDVAARQQALQSEVRYMQIGGETKAETASFFRLAEYFVSITREGMRSFYEDTRFSIMHKLLPENIHLKMRVSMFVQAWLPYLTRDDSDRLLHMLGFSNEYVEAGGVPGASIECDSCKRALFAPDGAYRVFCEHCRRTSAVRTEFFCSACGAPNSVPEDPSQPIDCNRCGGANRLIRPQFGA